MPSPVILHIHESDVQSFIRQGGEVHDMLTRVVRNTRFLSMQEAPARSGRLKRSFQSKHPEQTGPYSAKGRVSNNAKHAVWVHEGTGTITSTSHMLVPMNPAAFQASKASSGAGQELFIKWAAAGKKRGDRNFLRLMQVSGQQANPFMRRGLRRALAAEGMF